MLLKNESLGILMQKRLHTCDIKVCRVNVFDSELKSGTVINCSLFDKTKLASHLSE